MSQRDPETSLTHYTLHPSASEVLGRVRREHPHTPFLALGQTIWWDEPMKAVLRRMLDCLALGGQMILGVHDTDYFAKVRVRRPGQSRFELMPHNDGVTKDLWSAAGEVSRLFGSETYPTRHDLIAHNVPVDRLARASGRDRIELLNQVTEAWGWRGLVYTGSRDLIISELALAEVGRAILEMLRWGFDGTQESIVDACCRQKAQIVADHLLDRVRGFQEANPGATLSDLYQALFPRLMELLLGSEPAEVQVTSTSRLLRFTPETAGLPRFAFVDLFLNERTSRLAAEAYNAAVGGTEIYTLDRFGLGAVPFDLVIPGVGRGTLRVTLRALHVEARRPVRIPLRRPISSVRELAQVLADRFGEGVVLVGKAVALISMLAREFLFVFNEEGSGYVRLTRRMNDHLAAAGIDVPVHPILRLRYAAWDSLEVGTATLALPSHLASTFGRAQLPSRDLAAQWKSVVAGQDELLAVTRALRSPRDLLKFLAGRNGDDWEGRLARYEELKARQRALRARGEQMQAAVRALYLELAEIKRGIVETERRKGSHFRATIEWTEEEIRRRQGFEAALRDLHTRRRACLDAIRHHKQERLALERGAESTSVRREAQQIEDAAEFARMNLVRSAILTRTSLHHTNHRPTAWWLPMVDPSLRWFGRIVETTQVYTEPLRS